MLFPVPVKGASSFFDPQNYYIFPIRQRENAYLLTPLHKIRQNALSIWCNHPNVVLLRPETKNLLRIKSVLSRFTGMLFFGTHLLGLFFIRYYNF